MVTTSVSVVTLVPVVPFRWFRWFRWFRSGGSGGSVPVVTVVPFRWFCSVVPGFTTCQTVGVRHQRLLAFGPSLPSLTSDLTLVWPAGFSKRVASGTQGKKSGVWYELREKTAIKFRGLPKKLGGLEPLI